MSISAKKTGQLKSLFSMLPEQHRQTLVMTIKAAKADGEPGLPFDTLLTLLGDEAAPENRWKEIFTALTPLVVENSRRCDQIEETVLSEIWDYYLRDIDPTQAAAWLSGTISLADVRASIVASYTELGTSKSGKKKLEKRFGAEKLHQLEIVLSLMPRSDELEDFFDGWPESIKSLGDTHLVPLREFNEHLIIDSPEITPHLLFLVSAHLLHPFHVFRAVEKVTGHSNDRVMIKTELKVVGDALLDQNDVWLDAFAWERETRLDAQQAAGDLKQFLDLTSGWLSEFDVDPSGAWGLRLAAQRARCGKLWDSHMLRIQKNLEQVFPRKRGSVTGRQTMPDIAKTIDEHKVELAENAVEVLLATQPFASQGGFQSSKDKAIKLLDSRLAEQSDDLLAMYGKTPDDYEKISAHFAVLIRITRLYSGHSDAENLSRRSVAAMAA
jgi:hypothetical protein